MDSPATEIQSTSTTTVTSDVAQKEGSIADALLSNATGGESPKVSLTGEEKEPPAITDDLLRSATGGEVQKVPLTSEEAARTAVSLASVVLVQAVQTPSVIEVPSLVTSISQVIPRPATSVHHLTEIPTVQEEISTGYYQEDVYKSPVKGASKKSYDTGYKLKAIEFYKQGHSKLQTAKHFNVHPRRIREWITMEEVLKVSPSDRKRLTRRLLTKMKLSDSMIAAMKQLKSGGPGVEMSASAELQSTSGDQPQQPASQWVYQAPEGQQNSLSQLEQLANLTAAQSLQLSMTPSGSVIATQTIPSVPDQEPQVQVAEVNITTEPPSSLPAAHKSANIDYLKSLSKQQVQDLLDAMNLDKYKKAFSSEHVDGEILSSLAEEELVELGVNSGVHRIRFLKLIQGRHSAEDIVKSRQPQ